MQIIFLGTSAGIPTKRRNVSALGLRLENEKEWYLFDCGEATQHQILKTDLSIYNLSKIFITHLHGDHIYGLFGILASKNMQRAISPLEIYAPKGIKELLECVIKYSNLNLHFELKIFEITKKDVLKFEKFKIYTIPLSHSITSYGYVLVENDRPGRFDVQKAKSLGIPEGPLYAKLKNKEIVILEDGRVFDGNDFVGPPKKGKVVIIGGDNDNPLLFKDFNNADLMIHEATFTQKDFDNLEKSYKHTTSKQLAIAAKELGVKKLIITHISPRYDSDERVNELLEEAKKYYKGEVKVAYDFMKVVL